MRLPLSAAGKGRRMAAGPRRERQRGVQVAQRCRSRPSAQQALSTAGPQHSRPSAQQALSTAGPHHPRGLATRPAACAPPAPRRPAATACPAPTRRGGAARHISEQGPHATSAGASQARHSQEAKERGKGWGPSAASQPLLSHEQYGKLSHSWCTAVACAGRQAGGRWPAEQGEQSASWRSPGGPGWAWRPPSAWLPRKVGGRRRGACRRMGSAAASAEGRERGAFVS
jgi:hypothetical protein